MEPPRIPCSGSRGTISLKSGTPQGKKSKLKITSPSKSKPSIPLIDTAPTTSNIFSIPAAFSSSYKALSSSDESTFTPLPAETCPVVETETSITNTIPSTSQDAKQTSKSRKKDVLKEVLPLK
ncbi:hypothetical protein TNCV_1954171 [Trichonephila clavipes]|nr:hypothetical protein TNCV_1954171 [Trichonephila clavipes]